MSLSPSSLRSRPPLHVAIPWAVLALTVLADVLFYGHRIGWTLGAYGALVALMLVLRARPWARRWSERLFVLSLVPAAALVLRTGWLAAVMLLVLVAALAVAARGGAPALASAWPTALVRLAVTAWAWAWRDWAALSRWRQRGRRNAGKAPSRHFARNWGVPLGLTLVFLLLFSAANPVIALWVKGVRDWLKDILNFCWLNPVRWLFWLLVASSAWGLLRYRTRRAGPVPPPLPPGTGPRMPMLPLARTLGLFNAVFALQNLLDVRYLLCGAELPNHMTYAQYAHRGAYPLVATALLAGAFILWAFRPGRDGEDGSIVRGLLYAWIAQNVILTAAAAWRLWLYVGEFGLTRLRVAAAVWMALVAAGLVLAGARLAWRRTNNWLVYANLAALYAALSAWALVDMDGRIAQFNVSHCRELGGPGVPIDVNYLIALGPAALPALDTVESSAPDINLRERARAARRGLERRLDPYVKDWRGLTAQRIRLAGRQKPVEPAVERE